MKDRIFQLLKEKNLTAGKFAEILDVQPSSISHLLSGRNKPNFDFLVKLMDRFPDVDPDWFITGRGKMLRNAAPEVNVSEKNLSLHPSSLPERESELPGPGTVLPISGKKIERIVFFFTDRSFSVYTDGE